MPIAPFPERWPAGYRRFVDALGPDHPLQRVGHPDPEDAGPDPEALADPTGDRRLRPVPLLVRKHSDRVVLLVTRRCFQHCRFCFRRGDDRTGIDLSRDLDDALGWIGCHPEVREVILSGGDPLTLPDRALTRLGRRIGAIPHVEGWRVHTRAPVVAPERITPGLVQALCAGPRPRVVLHTTHPDEIRPAVADGVRRLQDGGIPVRDQSVLLAGVNDHPDTLADLYGGLARLGVAGHYLHHPDRVPGNRTFRVSIARGLTLHRGLRDRLGATVPPYVLDLACGAGKTPVGDLSPVAQERRGTACRTRYRWTRPAGWDAVAAPATAEWWDIWHTAVP